MRNVFRITANVGGAYEVGEFGIRLSVTDAK